ncbi:TonB-dependent receptor domain-containing protein [Novosphingobium terrae]|uniref:TonB-dependent receptor domain-containing protein n=1 Tax=Novosphingobium terrae TaxID=2726189 RepID=UPI00197D1CBF|nr:TonB-dependent receptor [Novosphingobium terrae]
MKAAGKSTASVADIIVTGSRVVTNGNASPQPVTVMQATELLKAQPTTLFDGLANMPIFASSRGQLSQPTAGPSAGGAGAVSALNLRNLSPLRNLVLLDGQRVPPSTYNGFVDIDIIPEAFIKRVDTVTGGVSAVYGSDAISGVINFVTDNHFNGVKVGGQYGISQYGDGAERKINVAWGHDLFGGRGHIEASFNHYDDAGILSRQDRPFNNNAYGGANTAASPYVLYNNVRQSNFTFGGLITNGPLAGKTFNTNGVLTPFVNGTPTGSANAQVGGDGAYNDSSIKSPLNSNQFFVRFDYDVSDDLHFHTQGMGDSKTTQQYISWNSLSNVTLSSSNAFLTPAQQASLAGVSTFTLSKILNQAPRYSIESHVDQYFVNTGLDGKFGKDTDWGIDFNYGKTVLNNTYHNNINNQKLSAALDAVNVSGTVQCYAATQAATAAAYKNCVPLNVFGPTAASDAALAYITDTTHLNVYTATYDLRAHIGTRLFDTWAGPVKAAFSAEWRKNSLAFNSDALPSSYADCTNLRYNCNVNTALNASTNANLPKVSQTVKEGAVEVLVPLLRDSAIGKALDFTGAARFTSYSTSGQYWTWKLGADWKINDSLMLRGTQSRDIRAPQLSDLYQPTAVVMSTFNDLLMNGPPYTNGVTYANIPSYNQGNPKLTAEKGNTRTFGAVWKPGFIPNFSISVDYFYIKITDAIQQLRGFDTAVQQACYQSGGSSPYCALQQRTLGNFTVSPANTIISTTAKNLNIAAITTQGMDVELNWHGTLASKPVSLRLFTTYQPHITFAVPGTVTLDQGGAAIGNAPFFASPAWRVNGSLHIDPAPAVGIDIRERWRSSMRYDGVPTDYFAQTLAAVAYTDLNLVFRIKDDRLKPEFYINIQNLFNKAPPAFAGGTTPGTSYAYSDDPVGRYFTVGVNTRF